LATEKSEYVSGKTVPQIVIIEAEPDVIPTKDLLRAEDRNPSMRMIDLKP